MSLPISGDADLELRSSAAIIREESGLTPVDAR